MGREGNGSHDVFKDSPAFPILLAALGIGVIIATVWIQRNAEMLLLSSALRESEEPLRAPGRAPSPRPRGSGAKGNSAPSAAVEEDG